MCLFLQGGGRGQGRAANGEDPPGQGKEDSSKIKIIFIAKLNPANHTFLHQNQLLHQRSNLKNHRTQTCYMFLETSRGKYVGFILAIPKM